jgi:sortase A
MRPNRPPERGLAALLERWGLLSRPPSQSRRPTPRPPEEDRVIILDAPEERPPPDDLAAEREAAWERIDSLYRHAAELRAERERSREELERLRAVAAKAEARQAETAREIEELRANALRESETQRAEAARETEALRTEAARETEALRAEATRETEALRTEAARETEALRTKAARETEVLRAHVAELETEREQMRHALDLLTDRIQALEGDREEALRAADAARQTSESVLREWENVRPALARVAERKRRRRSRSGRLLRGTGNALIWLGVVVLLFAGYEFVGTSLVGKVHQASLRTEFRNLTAAVTPTAPASTRLIAAPRPDGASVARLRVVRVGINVIVVEGTSYGDLAKGPGRYPGSALIGAPGATAIAGHRTGWGSPFLRLDRLVPADIITLETPAATYAYRVTRAVVVSPDDAWVLRGDPQSRAASQLVLTTCTPRFTARKRLIVWSNLVSAIPRV